MTGGAQALHSSGSALSQMRAPLGSQGSRVAGSVGHAALGSGRAFGLATLPPVWEQVSDLVFAEVGGPTNHSQLCYVRPTRRGGRDVIEARLERVTGATTTQVQELRTRKRFKIGHLSPEADRGKLKSWLDDLATTSW